MYDKLGGFTYETADGGDEAEHGRFNEAGPVFPSGVAKNEGYNSEAETKKSPETRVVSHDHA
jgi:hypothetical protein